MLPTGGAFFWDDPSTPSIKLGAETLKNIKGRAQHLRALVKLNFVVSSDRGQYDVPYYLTKEVPYGIRFRLYFLFKRRTTDWLQTRTGTICARSFDEMISPSTLKNIKGRVQHLRALGKTSGTTSSSRRRTYDWLQTRTYKPSMIWEKYIITKYGTYRTV